MSSLRQVASTCSRTNSSCSLLKSISNHTYKQCYPFGAEEVCTTAGIILSAAAGMLHCCSCFLLLINALQAVPGSHKNQKAGVHQVSRVTGAPLVGNQCCLAAVLLGGIHKERWTSLHISGAAL